MSGRGEERGFTLVELLVVVAVLGIIMSAIASSMIVVVRTLGGTADRFSQSHDSQLLSTWLVPDLQSSGFSQLTTATTANGIKYDPAPAPPSGGGTCASATAAAFTKLTLSWIDLASNVPFVAVYDIDPASVGTLRRTLAVDKVVQPSFAVAHNLENPAPSQPLPPGATARYPLCFERSSFGKVTVTLTTLVNASGGNGGQQYTFSVAAQTRQPYVPPAPLPHGPPVSGDGDLDGKVDSILVQFDQPVACVGTTPCDPSKWTVGNVPGAGSLSPSSVTISSADGKSATLVLPTALTTVDTQASGMTVALVAGSVAGAGGDAVINPPDPVVDGMAPVLVTATSRDADLSGTLDHVDVTFSEPLTGVPGMNDYKLLSGPDGDVSPTSVTASGTSAKAYSLAFPTVNLDTVAALAKVRITPGTATDGVRGNPPEDVKVADGMAPFLTGIVADQADSLGKINRITVTFTEAVTGNPTVADGATAVTSTAVPNTNTLVLNLSGAPVDTSTGSYRVSGAIADKAPAPNLLTLTNHSVSDAVSPILVAAAPSAPAVAPQGLIQTGDSVIFTFSEAVAPVPASVTMTVTESGSGKNNGITTFLFPGLGTIVLTTGNSTHYYSSGPLSCPMNLAVTGAVVTATVGAPCTGTPVQATAPADGSATPAAALKDVVNRAVLTGSLGLTSVILF